ncbi:hypothetical protein B0J14DRAFT_639578 [Halenospora varia]|nr:hypothetical protein B0J14DRAFT_639578 [Halenospora varia]
MSNRPHKLNHTCLEMRKENYKKRIRRPPQLISPYFADKFADKLFEGDGDNFVLLEPIPGVVSDTSEAMLIEWLYCGSISMKRCCTIPEAISRALEFARIADLAQIDGVGEAVAEYIYTVIIRDSDSNSQGGSNISYFSAEVLRCAFKLPRGHPIRAMVAAAFVKEFRRIKGYLGSRISWTGTYHSNYKGAR